MTDRVAELMDELTPEYDDCLGDWERVAADALQTARRRALSRPLRGGLLFAAVAAVAALVLAWPFSSQVNVLERARAAVSGGPVLHVILRGTWGGTLLNLGSGARTPVYGEDEYWFDTTSRQTHEISRLGNVVQDEELSTPNKPAAELVALGKEYKEALKTGTARIVGDDTIDGQPVVWVTVHSEHLPDIANGKKHEWTQQVAISKTTFKPVALRETLDGKPGPGTLQRVIGIQMLQRNQADFRTSRPSLAGTAFRETRKAVSLSDAASVLGQTPLWLGDSHDGLALAQAYRETISVGQRQRVRVTGAKAAAAIKCSQQRGGDARACFRALGLPSVEVRPDGIYTTHGPITWGNDLQSLVFFYGTVGDDPSTYKVDKIPLLDKPYINVTEATKVLPLRRGAGAYVPPQGSVFITAGGRLGYLQKDGVKVSLEAANDGAVVAAARSLSPMPH